MPRNTDQRTAFTTLAAMAAAVLIHLALLALPLPNFEHGPDMARPAPLSIEILTGNTPPETAISEPQAPQEQDRTSARPPPIPRPEESEPAPDESISGQAASAATVRAETASPSAGGLRSRVLGEAARIGRSLERSGEDPGFEFDPVPALPGRSGWLHRYTGRVARTLDRWREGDGGHSARLVVGSGRVICIRTRAPTTEEIFNPWMSSAVPMMRDCGRERPTLDASDPWLRRPAPSEAKVRRPASVGR